MNKSRWIALGCAAVALAWGVSASAVGVGAAAPEFKLKDLDGREVSLKSLAGKTVVLEWVNPECPFSDRHAREKTMSNLAKKYGKVVWLGINSTSSTHANYLEPAKHKAWVSENGVPYSILYDSSGDVGRAYGARTTPHLFVIDPQGKVAYNGAIDDDPRGKNAQAARRNYVDGGLAAALSGKAIDPAVTEPYGCSVKY
jgi:peroxiredoxin